MIANTIHTIERKDEQHSFLFIANNDGTPRWIWPSYLNKPVFLNFYPTQTLKQLLFSCIVKLVFFLGIQRWVFKTIDFQNSDFRGDWALFTGTVGPNNKQILYKDGARKTFTKIAKSDRSRQNLKNEYEALKKINQSKGLTFRSPNIMKYSSGQLEIEKLESCNDFKIEKQKLISTIGEISNIKMRIKTLQSWSEWNKTISRIKDLKCNRRIPNSLIENLKKLANRCNSAEKLYFSFSHGDFTPWNLIRMKNEVLGVIDWEMAREEMPAGYDYFHYQLQNGIFLESKSWDEIYSGIQEDIDKNRLVSFFSKKESNDYIKLYLLHHISYYINIYQEQGKWHEQVFWQLKVWSDALLWCLKEENNRILFLKEFFNSISSQNYACLKKRDESIYYLNENSDIDVLIPQKEYTYIINIIRKNPLIKSIKIYKQTFMSNVFIVFNDNRVLSLDFIWRIKRRTTVFMDIDDTLNSAELGNDQVKKVSNTDTARFIKRFYTLNNSKINSKYFEFVKNHLSQKEFNQSKRDLRKELNESKWNKNFSKISNCLSYLQDSIYSLFNNHGFVMTFSGVDGVGKSTIINEVKGMIEKKLRRSVVVLRHRPSLLPILSAWKYGKKEAEERSVASLPRTGTNASILSSILRFLYYYLDYVAGQFVIFFKYVARGKVVIYDRYYFDFMLDGKRSNLSLPNWITRLGYRLLLTPKHNFFLFANSDIILKRKQELDEKTIRELTKSYKALFNKLSTGTGSSSYQCLENVHIERTKSLILQDLIRNIK